MSSPCLFPSALSCSKSLVSVVFRWHSHNIPPPLGVLMWIALIGKEMADKEEKSLHQKMD
jgi:hypothetical protein